MTTQNQSLTVSKNRKEVEFPVEKNGDVSIGKITYQVDGIAAGNTDLLQGVIYLIEANSATELSTAAIWSFRKACEINGVKCQELIDAFWKAYSDPYVGREGVQWRHLYKYISDARGEKEKTYTYHQMLSEMEKQSMPQEAFEILNGENGRPLEKDSSGKYKWRLKR